MTEKIENLPVLPKKRGRKPKPGSANKEEYFGQREEKAIKDYLIGGLNPVERNELFKTIIDPCLRKLVDGVMQMPKFQKILGITREQLQEDAYFHLIFQMEKFKPDRIGKSGELVKAYSYFGTIVKNYILGLKIANDGNIANYGGMLDVDELTDHIPDNRRNPEEFEELKGSLVAMLEKAVDTKRLNKNDLIVGNTLKYMLANWHRLEFQSKNEFVRLLCHYTQLNPPVVARSLKKYKTLVYDSLTPPKPKAKKAKVKIVSTLDSVITTAFNMTNINEAKRKVCDYLNTSNIKEIDKQTMLLEIGLTTSLSEFHTYIANCLLKYEGLGINKVK